MSINVIVPPNVNVIKICWKCGKSYEPIDNKSKRPCEECFNAWEKSKNKNTNNIYNGKTNKNRR